MVYTEKEQREHRWQWIDILRSGDYEQAKHEMRNGDRYCCLGVACDISGLGEWVYSSGGYEYVVDGQGKKDVLPLAVMDWLGLNQEAGEHYVNGSFSNGTSLGELNDDGLTFEKIADIIEEEPMCLLA